jgi:DNA (cytosine-5)-methyltransferase 1
MTREKLTALGAHVYAGGFTVGVRRAGFRVLAHLEEWEFGVETARRNLGVEVRVGPGSWHPEEFRGADLVYCNPPCASWSEAGRKVIAKERNTARWSHDGRTKCTELCFELVAAVRPKVFIWESVAAATVNGAGFVEGRIALCHDLGYDVHGLLFNGADCGLPQTRRRFFFVASRVRFDPRPPPLVEEAARRGVDPCALWRTPRQVIRQELGRRVGEYERVLKTYDRIVDEARPGEPLHKAYMRLHRGRPPVSERGQRADCPGFMHQKVDPDRHAPTVTGSAHLYHWGEHRTLSVDEMKVICGYPANYEFVGRLGDRYAQIAKAVLPPPAEWLARQVRAAIEAGRPVGRRRTAELHNFIHERRRFADAWRWESGRLTTVVRGEDLSAEEAA